MNKLIKGFFLGAILGTLFAMILGNLAYAGGADQYRCVKVKKTPVCKVKTVVKYKTKVKYSVIDRPVQQIVFRYKPVHHKNRISLLLGQSYDNDAKLKTTTRLSGPYNNVATKHFSIDRQKKKNNFGIQYMRDIYLRPNFSVHGLIQFQTISGASLGLGIGF